MEKSEISFCRRQGVGLCVNLYKLGFVGCMQGESGNIFSPGKDPKDHEKENLRRIKEIQKRFREQERSREQGQSRPLKALWRSPKYDKVESRVKAQLQVLASGSQKYCPSCWPRGSYTDLSYGEGGKSQGTKVRGDLRKSWFCCTVALGVLRSDGWVNLRGK